jgi:hypothetical protein
VEKTKRPARSREESRMHDGGGHTLIREDGGGNHPPSHRHLQKGKTSGKEKETADLAEGDAGAVDPLGQLSVRPIEIHPITTRR